MKKIILVLFVLGILAAIPIVSAGFWETLFGRGGSSDDEGGRGVGVGTSGVVVSKGYALPNMIETLRILNQGKPVIVENGRSCDDACGDSICVFAMKNTNNNDILASCSSNSWLRNCWCVDPGTFGVQSEDVTPGEPEEIEIEESKTLSNT